MFLMLAEVLRLYNLATVFPDNVWLDWLRFHTTHVEWVGCSLHDLIQPGFSFLVGAALPFSLRQRARQGHAPWRLYVHAAWRSLLLIALGIFVRSLNSESTNFTFEDTLTQIGLGYFILFLIGRGPRWLVPTAIVTILVGYWVAFAVYQPPSDFDYPEVGVPTDWPEHHSGIAAAWNKNSNLAWAFDTWFLNLFPRPESFEYHRGGYSTLNFIPTLATMLMGLLAGQWLADSSNVRLRLLQLTSAIAIGLLVGWGLDVAGWCPMVKRIWTPSFALWSGGWCFVFVLFFHVVCDVWRWQSWAFPLVVIGTNCILVYLLNWTIKGSILNALDRHVGSTTFEVLGPEYADLLRGLCVLAIFWGFLYWLWRKKLFIKI